MKTAVEASTVEKFDNAEKEKKKKRRSNRRSKQNSASTSASPSLVDEISGVSAECTEISKTPVPVTASLSSSLKQQEVNTCSPGDQGLPGASNAAFESTTSMHVNEQENSVDLPNMQIHGGAMPFKSFSEINACLGSLGTYTNKDPFPSCQAGVYVQGNYFSPHWPVEAVEKAAENGEVFIAPFHVNAHNRLEAYCRIDGVPTDILISGIPAQNRAVEGDIVAVKIDPVSLWTKLKGSNGTCNSTAPIEDCNIYKEENEVTCNNNRKGKVDSDYGSAHYRSCPGQNKVDADQHPTPYGSCPFPDKRYFYEDSASHSSTLDLDIPEPASHDDQDGHHFSHSDSLGISSSSGQIKVVNAVEKMCSLLNHFPSKRPTGRVVAIIENSPRRRAIVGHLNVKQWVSFKDTSRKSKILVSEHEYIQLTPTDPKLPKMMLLVRELPDVIKNRLHSGDVTIDTDLLAAQIDDWTEESPFPLAHIMHIFGRSGELQPQLDAILFENAICLSDFSPEALSGLPHVPWEVPLKEIHSRIDLRNLCIFTVDPSSATDLDDALSIEKLANGNFRVGVHIADVSYFVLPDTALDSEALSRATSVYMVHGKLSMLPALISEDIGSLNPGVDRLAVSMFLDINLVGDVVDRWIGRTVIQSCCKLSYEHAQDIIDGVLDIESSKLRQDYYPKVHGCFEWHDVITSFKTLYEVSQVLKSKRFNDGALRLDNSKIVFQFDEHGIPHDSMLLERKESNFLVEEFMLLANTTAAEVICRAYPDGALLRRHPEPNKRKLREFEAFCQKHGLELDTSSSGRFYMSLEQIKEKLKDDSVLCDVIISYATRPMQLASYFCSGDFKDNEKDWAHYALAVPFYTHFTSPLRRYPDIVVHRILLATIEAEELCLKQQKALQVNEGKEVQNRCFTGINFDKIAAESKEGREALSAAALKHKLPCTDVLTGIATYCNERRLASRNVRDACDKLYMWLLLKKKEVLLSEARILGLGPRFMSIYIQKLAMERRIYYDEVEGLTVEWLDTTSTLVLSMCSNRRPFRRGSPGKWRALEEVALVSYSCDLKVAMDGSDELDASETELDPAVFPLTVRLLSTIPVALHAIGGNDGPLDIGVRLYMTSYFR